MALVDKGNWWAEEGFTPELKSILKIDIENNL